MVWLENMQAKEGESFADLVAPLDPVINRGIAGSSGPRKADLLAHAGWATFLKWRAGQRGLDPDPQYGQALATDANNPYANAYRAHWLLWTRNEKALRGTHAVRRRAGIRPGERARAAYPTCRLQSGLRRGPEFFAAVNEMRMKGETIPSQTRSDLFNGSAHWRADP